MYDVIKVGGMDANHKEKKVQAKITETSRLAPSFFFSFLLMICITLPFAAFFFSSFCFLELFYQSPVVIFQRNNRTKSRKKNHAILFWCLLFGRLLLLVPLILRPFELIFQRWQRCVLLGNSTPRNSPFMALLESA